MFQPHDKMGVTLVSALGIALLSALLAFLRKLYHARMRMLRLQSQGLPMPPYNPLFGHLPFLHAIRSHLPHDAHPGYLADAIRRAVPALGPVYYLDPWPLGPQMLIVASPEALRQIAQEHPLAKYHLLKDFLRPITEGLDIVTMEGARWRKWRGVFNPGFGASHLMTLTAAVVEEVGVFCERLQGLCATREVFRMKGLTDYLALDVIGRVVLDTKLDSQRHPNPLVDGLRSQIRWLHFGLEASLVTRLNPLRPLVQWYNTGRMNTDLSPRIDRAMAKVHDASGNKSVVHLALASLLSDPSSAAKDEKAAFFDPAVKQIAMSQVKLFLFSGHDTTSSALCYLFYALSRHPAALASLRAEHDRVFGPCPSPSTTSSTSTSTGTTPTLAAQLSANPALLNRLPYTHAVIKETLRLYPPVSSVRGGEAGFAVADDQGRHFPTDGFLVWANSQAVHRDPEYWPRADEFWPERWLTIRNDPRHPLKGAWRPFELGPRNCIGQELAVLEMKVVLVMVARRFAVEPVYGEEKGGRRRGRVDTVYGERGYQIARGQPSGDLPCRVVSRVQVA